MKKLSILVVDDEVLMCEELQAQLENYLDVEVVATCHDGDSALEKAVELHPDVVFLDIQMPGKSGLEVAAILSRQADPPTVVFLTAFADYALKAFGVDAVDYVLKPFDEHDIKRVIAKLRRMHSGRNPGHASPIPAAERQVERDRRFCVYHDGRFEVIENERIRFFQARDRLVFVQTVDDRHYPVKSSLNELEEKLDQKLFVRCHRNYIVNVQQIAQLENWFNRGYMLILKGVGQNEVPVSRLYVKKLKEFLAFE